MTAPTPEKAVRDPATGRYAHSGDLSRVCVCGHELGDHVHGGFECLGAGAPCGCEKFRPAPKKAAPIPALLPCPFCGADEDRLVCSVEGEDDYFNIGCEDCDCRTAWFDNQADAASAWNRRADRASQEERIREDERANEGILPGDRERARLGGYEVD